MTLLNTFGTSPFSCSAYIVTISPGHSRPCLLGASESGRRLMKQTNHPPSRRRPSRAACVRPQTVRVDVDERRERNRERNRVYQRKYRERQRALVNDRQSRSNHGAYTVPPTLPREWRWARCRTSQSCVTPSPTRADQCSPHTNGTRHSRRPTLTTTLYLYASRKPVRPHELSRISRNSTLQRAERETVGSMPLPAGLCLARSL
jgi:hypothetical protein